MGLSSNKKKNPLAPDLGKKIADNGKPSRPIGHNENGVATKASATLKTRFGTTNLLTLTNQYYKFNSIFYKNLLGYRHIYTFNPP